MIVLEVASFLDFLLQQHLPLAVLKLSIQEPSVLYCFVVVATALTACGIETSMPATLTVLFTVTVATALTACGIETLYRKNE